MLERMSKNHANDIETISLDPCLSSIFAATAGDHDMIVDPDDSEEDVAMGAKWALKNCLLRLQPYRMLPPLVKNSISTSLTSGSTLTGDIVALISLYMRCDIIIEREGDIVSKCIYKEVCPNGLYNPTGTIINMMQPEKRLL